MDHSPLGKDQPLKCKPSAVNPNGVVSLKDVRAHRRRSWRGGIPPLARETQTQD